MPITFRVSYAAAEVASSADTPSAAAEACSDRPLAPPSTVRSPAARPRIAALRMTRAWSGPGRAMRSTEAAENSMITLTCHHAPSDMSRAAKREHGPAGRGLLEVLREVLGQVERRRGLLVVDLFTVGSAERVGRAGCCLLLLGRGLLGRLGRVAGDPPALALLGCRLLLPALAATGQAGHPRHTRHAALGELL